MLSSSLATCLDASLPSSQILSSFGTSAAIAKSIWLSLHALHAWAFAPFSLSSWALKNGSKVLSSCSARNPAQVGHLPSASSLHWQGGTVPKSFCSCLIWSFCSSSASFFLFSVLGTFFEVTSNFTTTSKPWDRTQVPAIPRTILLHMSALSWPSHWRRVAYIRPRSSPSAVCM